LGFILSVAAGVYFIEIDAKDNGFANSTERNHASKYQITEAGEWERRKPEIEEQESIKKAEVARVAADAKLEREKTATAERLERERVATAARIERERAANAARIEREEAERLALEREMSAKFVTPANATMRQKLFIVKAQEAAQQRLTDPDSAQFRNLYFHSPQKGIMVVCGEVNARNQFGGYTGYKSFLSNSTAELTVFERDMKAGEFRKSWKKLCQ
jgi:flagellar biosynthesis GTPase FlhF